MGNNFSFKISNKISLTGVIFGNGTSYNSNWNIYHLNIRRNALDFGKDCNNISGEAIDEYTIFVKKGIDIKNGNLVRISGKLCQRDGFGKKIYYTCPVCGTEQKDEKITFVGIYVKKISIINNTDGYNANLLKTYMPEITVNDVWIENVELYRDKNCGDITYYKSLRFPYVFCHKGLDENLHERYEIHYSKDENDIGYIGTEKYYQKKGRILKGKGKVALANRNYEQFMCWNCNQWTKIENNYPTAGTD